MGKEGDDQYGDEEIARRRDEALLRALNTPPKRHSEMKLGNAKPKAGVSPKKRRAAAEMSLISYAFDWILYATVILSYTFFDRAYDLMAN